MISVSHAFMLLCAAPGVLLLLLSFRSGLANPAHTLIGWFLGAFVGGKLELIFFAPTWRDGLTELKHHPIAPLGLWGVAIGSSVFVALAFVVSRPPKTTR